jgi:cyclic lactone autoinducer peptide
MNKLKLLQTASTLLFALGIFVGTKTASVWFIHQPKVPKSLLKG